ncbi:MAG: topoisomerase C-terminal repeat-containing protein, partial [Betaproteobacteria bacterium AqS2]|nr:topoisomerase C-terminal repeat-containing protein [Betaproteobacteria bacterium AqS2]
MAPLPTLVIAEKPSVAQDIARALGIPRKGEHFEGGEWLITSAVGHLVEIYDPAAETEDYKKVKGHRRWSFESLPMLPPRFALRPSKDGAARVRLIAKLAKKAGAVVNACDAGREGELIFHYIASYLGLEQPVRRLWLQSMTPDAIRTAFDDLRAHGDFANLCSAAIARNEADWLVGINATQALTALNNKDAGGFNLTNAGRVQTPTLALLVEREAKRQAHVPEPYWHHDAVFGLAAGEYAARWSCDLGPEGGDPFAKRSSWQQRIKDEAKAKELEALLKAEGIEGEVFEQSKERRIGAPKLFDLNALQREANSMHSLPARRTLAAAQALYERHKLITYPRTESRYLPADYAKVCGDILTELGGGGGQPWSLEAPARAAAGRLDAAGKAIFDDAKVTDHFAIIPTERLPGRELPEVEAKVYELILRRFVAAFLPPAVVKETARATVVDGRQVYVANGRVIVDPGWQVANRQRKEDSVLPPLETGEKAKVLEAELLAKETTPPARYDDASLLGAMQGAAKMVEDSEIANALSETGGLGTPATRAGIIEHLILYGYVVRNGKELVPTLKAFSLLEILRGMEIVELVQPNLTGEWERRLRRIEEGAEGAGPFMEDIRGLATRICDVAKVYDPDATPGDYVDLKTPCPKCGGAVKEQYRRYRCAGCGFYVWKTIGGRELAPAEAEELFAGARVGPFADFRSRRGLPFTACIELLESGKANLLFESDLEDEEDPAELRALAPCPKEGCDGEILVGASSFRCAKSFNGGSCDFKLGKTICRKELATDEVKPLFASRRSALLEGFVSKRGKPFKA